MNRNDKAMRVYLIEIVVLGLLFVFGFCDWYVFFPEGGSCLY